MKHVYSMVIVVFFFFLTLTSLHAQIHINNTGSVSVGDESISENTKMQITEEGITASSYHVLLNLEYLGTSAKQHRGIQSIVEPSTGYGYAGYFRGGYMGISSSATGSGIGERYGLYAYGANGSTNNFGIYSKSYGGEYSYGVYGIAYAGSECNYGVYGFAASGYAGYFEGNVYCTGTISTNSDARFKKNIEDIGSDMLDKLKKVKSRSYEYKTEEYTGMPEGKNFGFVAQELEEVFPELVSTHKVPPAIQDPSESIENESGISSQSTKKMDTAKGVNYIGMIPVLVEAIQEQQAQIEKQQTQIEQQQKEIETLKQLAEK